MTTTQDAVTTNTPKVLVSGAGFAGLTAAFWMHRLGYQVTIVERGAGLKRGGTPVDIKDDTVGIAERMGILEAIRAKSLPPRRTEFTNLNGGTDVLLEAEQALADDEECEYEIPRDDLLDILYGAVEGNVEVRFNDSITELTDGPDGVRASFREGADSDFDLILGCDGNHSNVRKLRFGPEVDFTHFLHNYFTVTIVDESLIPRDTTRILSTPGRTLMLNAYEDKTDIGFLFHSDEKLAYDYHDEQEQKDIVRAAFVDAGPQFTAFLDKGLSADSFYFDELTQTRMEHWSSGRVGLVGDAGYCASPAAGMGGSLAIIGATALYDAFVSTNGDIDAGFAEYEKQLRPVVEQIQAMAVNFGLATFFPETDEAIRARNSMLSAN
ncbi:FAD-binding monooxygenase [Frigoribacterium sp. Leaf164]|uniref:FAD-dependent monooxygenase n=1 Tax=Frigoribacterium sp. Leaf164 TaxID=1736282 RepID=UPI0006F5F1EA|nr:FAD-dependent monooxygenase [Frigoribacterium sp. Leaf164]KQR44530.1 FAD-binding monooxygenase [Frigoribacterium sp. Leaf164]